MNNSSRAQFKNMGFQQITGLTSAQSMTVPKGSKFAMITCTGQPVRMRDDGTAPTATVGIMIPVNTPFWYSGNLNSVQFFESGATAVVDVSYFS